LDEKAARLEKYIDASNLDVSDLERSYLDDGDFSKSNFSFKGGKKESRSELKHQADSYALQVEELS